MRTLSVVLFLSLLPHLTAAQLIQVKTIPVAAGDQFTIVPSRALGMGGVTIALDDPLADPFANPAKGARLTGSSLLAAPSFYSISQNAGSAGTLPVGALLAPGAQGWFGGGVLAFQQLSAGDRFDDIIPLQGGGTLLSEGSGNNLYGTVVFGRRLGEGDLAVGVGAFIADLAAMDGVDLLYPGNMGLSQSGNLIDVRVGVAGTAASGGTFEVLAVHNRVDMTHEVTWPTFEPLPGGGTRWSSRVEANLDRTNTWGVHGAYVHPLDSRSRLGGTLTVNRKSHPKIPNYQLMNIPRDPGTTWAYALGIGFGRTAGDATLGVDVIVQPIRTHTWAEAATPIVRPDGSTIPIGGATVDNRFRFTNATLRLGLEQQVRPATFALGLELNSVNYTLRQADLVARTNRSQSEHWIEWTPTIGASIEFEELTLRYAGRLTTGTGRPGVAALPTPLGFDGGRQIDFIPAPAGPLTLNDAVVLSHQVSVVMPLR